MKARLGVAVVGCGLIGSRRTAEVAKHPGTELTRVVDTDRERAAVLAEQFRCTAESEWRSAVSDPATAVIIVSTPNAYLLPIALAALANGKHVLIEKPFGRNLTEARELAEAAARAAPVMVKAGFNHRYHPAVAKAHTLYRSGLIGEIINIRARYGHGGRLGYENEWRGSAHLAGGGELTDQGIHIADLLNWFLGMPQSVYCITQTAVWPIRPLEDNAFGLLRYASGAVASCHTSWTQWRNLFSLELFGQAGSLCVEGLSGSYGDQRLTIALRTAQGGPPDIQ